MFEDFDSLCTESCRSFLLNEVSGLESNDGIIIFGLINYLKKLDAGITKRSSYFAHFIRLHAVLNECLPWKHLAWIRLC